MIYGYSEKIIESKYGLLQLREVSLKVSPPTLRKIAAFLESAAADLESGEFKGDHRHLRAASNDWPEKGFDIIVLRPSDAD